MKQFAVAVEAILRELPVGRAWLAELIETLRLADICEADFGEVILSEKAAAAVIVQLRPEHVAALAAILLQDRIEQELRPSRA